MAIDLTQGRTKVQLDIYTLSLQYFCFLVFRQWLSVIGAQHK